MNKADSRAITLSGQQPQQLNADTTVVIGRFIPDYVIRDNQIYKRSNSAVNPAIQLLVQKAGVEPKEIWLFPSAPDAPPAEFESYQFAFKPGTGTLAPFTGLAVSHEPGQWAVWGGCVLMGIGLTLAFYCVHRRYWAAISDDPKLGRVLWIGTQADKNREHYAEEFQSIIGDIRAELLLQSSVTPEERSAPERSLASV